MLNELRPMLNHYIQAARQERTPAIQKTFASPSRPVPTLMPTYDKIHFQAPHRSSQRSSLPERDGNSNSNLKGFNHFHEQIEFEEGEWPSTTPSSNSRGFVNQESYFPTVQPAYNSMMDPAFHSQVEAMVANMMPGLIQQMQQGASPIRNYAAEAADLSSKIVQQSTRQARQDEPPSLQAFHSVSSRKKRADSGYIPLADATNGEASNRGRALNKSKGGKRLASRNKKGGAGSHCGELYRRSR